MTHAARVQRFRELHRSGCFVIPNPWDLGSARLLVAMGFPSVATTSAGFAWSIGRRDNAVTLDECLAHLRIIASGVANPLFEFALAVERVRAFAPGDELRG